MKSLYEGARTRIRVDCELSKEFKVIVGMYQGSELSPFLFAVVVDVVTVFSREGALGVLLYADDLVSMSKTINGFWNKFVKWKEAFESKGLKVNLGKTKVMVDPCGVCSFGVMSNSVLCLQCGRWIHGWCAGVKRVNKIFAKIYMQKIYDGNIGEAVLQEEKLCDEVETVREFPHLSDRVSACGGCEAAQDVGGLCLGNAVSCCISRCFV